jgi:methyl-accepting chemotaxis protein-like sensor
MQGGTRQVEQGVEATSQAGQSLRRIIKQTEHVGGLITHIATAATEQSTTTDQVNSSRDQINKLVAESADGAQQSAQACEELSNLALNLQKIVSRFRLGEHSAPGPGGSSLRAGAGRSSPRPAGAGGSRRRPPPFRAPRLIPEEASTSRAAIPRSVALLIPATRSRQRSRRC